ncbi:MAG: CBS domain-containing protein [Sulfolobales archaeon]
MQSKISSIENFTRKNPYIFKDEIATKARALMRELGLRILVVVESNGRISGVLWRENILAIASSRSNLLVRDLMVEPQLVGFHGDNTLDLVIRMLDNDIWYIPVADSRSEMIYKGVFGFEFFIEKMIRDSEIISILKEVKAIDIMSKKPIYLTPNTYVSTVWKNMIKFRFSGFPVVDEKGVVVGMVTQHDLLRTSIAFQSERGPRKGPKVSTLMSRPPITVRENDRVLDVAEILIKRNIGRVPVVDEKGILKGIIDRSDIVREIIRILR